ncbi:MAG: HDIG domain-containing protein, partial [bacterium]|nr:HDIG domain-containing protein [bacterium]
MTTRGKRQYVEALQEGDYVDDYFVAIRKDLREQQKGGKFLGMVFKDRTGEIGGILWTNAVAVARQFELGDVVNVRGNITSYQDRLQVRVEQVLPLREDEYSIDGLVFVPEDATNTFDQFCGMLDSVSNEWLSKLVTSFLEDEVFVDRFKAAAAGKKWHHANHGGLVLHCYEMAKLAQATAEVYPNVDLDLLLTAILLHDCGKLVELTQGLFVEYTDEGKLLGHLAIGAQMVQDRI